MGNMNYVLITSKNIEDFRKILPMDLSLEKNRLTIGAYRDDGEICGAISYSLVDYRYDVDWLYVAPAARRQGVATALMAQVFDFIRTTLEVYPLVSRFEVSEEDTSLHGFFLSLENFDTAFSHQRCYLRPEELIGSPELGREIMEDFTEEPFFSLSGDRQKDVLDMITSRIYITENLDEWKEKCIPELCRAAFIGDEFMGAVFFCRRADGNVELSCLYSRNPVIMKKLIYDSAKKLKQAYPDSWLIVDVIGDRAGLISHNLFPKARYVDIYEASW